MVTNNNKSRRANRTRRHRPTMFCSDRILCYLIFEVSHAIGRRTMNPYKQNDKNSSILTINREQKKNAR